jgi:hypothetical protein
MPSKVGLRQSQFAFDQVALPGFRSAEECPDIGSVKPI